MRRTAVTFLLVSLVALPATLAAGGVVGLATTGAATGPVVDPGGASRSGDGSGITHFTLGGRGPVAQQDGGADDADGPRYVWASESLELATTVHVEPDDRPREVCVTLHDAEGATIGDLGCRTWNASTQWKRVTHSLDGWPAEAEGASVVRVELVALQSNETADGGTETERVRVDVHETTVHVIEKQGDVDDDGLSNGREVELGTDITRADTDGDGLSDRDEVYRYDTDPLAADTSGDGLRDGTPASLWLPPTVPYVVHAVAVAGVLALATLGYAAVRIRRVLRTASGGTAYESSQTVSAIGPGRGDDGPDTKEDEILRVIREHDGRMRQADLVDETEWSKATVSRLLSSLEDEGRVEKIRIGRGNVVQLTGGGAPYDDRSGASG